MDGQQRSFLVTGIILVVILAIIVGSVVFLIRTIQSRRTPTSSARPSATVSVPGITPSPQVSILPANLKSQTVSSLELKYSKNWGILTCSNSQNIEFDPNSPTDQLNFLCDVAIKPVTVLVAQATCQGQVVKLGITQAVKEINYTQTGVNYKWCTITQPNLEISHRVSSTGEQATSSQDFSKEIEQMLVDSFGTPK